MRSWTTNIERDSRFNTLIVTGIYLIFSSIWILLSDRFVSYVAGGNPETIQYYQSIKDLCFVILSSALIYGLLRWLQNREQELESLYKKIIHAPSQFYWLADRTGKTTNVSEGFELITGRHLEVLNSTSWLDIFHPNDRDRFNKIRNASIANQSEYEATFRLKGKDGVYHYMHAREVPVFDALSNDVTGWVGSAIDITLSKSTEKKLDEERFNLRLAESVGGIYLWHWDTTRNIVKLSRYLKDELGFNSITLKNGLSELFKIIHPDDKRHILNISRKIIKGELPDHEGIYRIRNRHGEYRWHISRLTPVINEEGRIKGLTGANIDITKQKANEERLAYLANHDELTGLYNRRYMYDLVAEEIGSIKRKPSTVGFLFIDIDHFKDINSYFGDTVGNQVLQGVGQRILNSLKAGETVGRNAADEYIVISLNPGGQKGLSELAERIMRSMDKEFLIGERKFYGTLTIGGSLYPDTASNKGKLISQAETAAAHAKLKGANRYQFFSEGIEKKENETAALVSAIKHGIENDEFYAVFQPQYDLRHDRFIGAEALARWNSTTLGHVPPGIFIPIAEKAGLITEISYIIIESAINTLSSLHKAGHHHMRMSVNIEVSQLYEPDFIDWILHYVDRHTVNPESIEIEVTENVLMKDAEYASAVLRQLQRRGFRVAIDDFGTGHSSLSYLGTFSVDILKIDKSFIDNVLTSDSCSKIVQSILVLAKSLQLDVIAEGIESKEQHEFIEKSGCNFVQGYYYSKPISEDKLICLLQETLDSPTPVN